MLNDTLKTRRVVTAIALDGRSEADLLELVESAPELARLDGLDEVTPSGISGSWKGQPVAIGNAAYFSALGVPIHELCDWPDRSRSHGEQVLLVAIDGRAAGFVGVAIPQSEKGADVMKKSMRVRLPAAIAITALIVGVLASGQALMMATGVKRPAESEFGLGPRMSDGRMYTAMLLRDAPLRVRKMQSMTVVITDAGMHPIDNAQITIDGGMPQHGHGLPTQPRVTSNTGGGVYEIEGVRFNMGGWWEFRLWITTPAGRDVVTFNLSL